MSFAPRVVRRLISFSALAESSFASYSRPRSDRIPARLTCQYGSPSTTHALTSASSSANWRLARRCRQRSYVSRSRSSGRFATCGVSQSAQRVNSASFPVSRPSLTTDSASALNISAWAPANSWKPGSSSLSKPVTWSPRASPVAASRSRRGLPVAHQAADRPDRKRPRSAWASIESRHSWRHQSEPPPNRDR